MASSVTQEPSADLRNWAELPWDVLSVIFEKLGAFEILLTAQAVCRPWWRLSLEPRIWRCVDLVRGASDRFVEFDFEKIAKAAVDRGSGQLEKFYATNNVNDELLKYISDRTTLLRCLRLKSCYVSDEGLIDLAKKFHMLEELEVSYCPRIKKAHKYIGHCFPQLKCFSLNSKAYKYQCVKCDEQALAIAEGMPELRKLQLFGNKLTNDGLLAILDGCPNLEFLDLRHCFNVNLEGNLLKRFERIKDLRLPCDSTSDYLYVADIDKFESREDGYDDYRSVYSDIDRIFHDMFLDEYGVNVANKVLFEQTPDKPINLKKAIKPDLET